MKYNIKVLSEAIHDIDEAFLWYELNQVGLGDKFISSIEKSFEAISINPSGYIKIYQEIRRILLHNFPYGVYYLTDHKKKEISVIGIIHFKRNPHIWKHRAKKI
jgi:plasmid stabilization system protein ParE